MIDTYRNLHLFFGGCFQRLGREDNGLYEVFDQVYRRYAGPETLVLYQPWYIHPADIAAEIVELNENCLKVHGEPLQIQLVGYSFGGQTVANVCRAVDETTDTPRVTIDRLCLCDAVARYGRLGWLRAANPFSTIVLPPNIDRAAAFVQRHRRWRLQRQLFFPAGHRLVIESEVPSRLQRTRFNPETNRFIIEQLYRVERLPIEPVELPLEHSEMDSAEEFHTAVLSDAAEMHRPGGTAASQILPMPWVA